MIDLVLRSARVVCAATGHDAVADVAINDGKIIEVNSSVSMPAKTEIDFSGKIIVPGIIDSHVHLGINALGFRMCAAVGVTTALDMAGECEDILRNFRTNGCGINIGMLQAILAGKNISGNDVGAEEIDGFISQSLKRGAYGVKLLGGHYPLTPEASARFVQRSNDRGVYVAWHAGSTANGSNINGMRETVELCGDNRLHLCHINAYCRGAIKPVQEETLEAIELLKSHPNITSESYLSPRNGSRLNLNEDGSVKSGVTRNCLTRLGLPLNAQGVEKALMMNEVGVIVERNAMSVLVSGEEGIRLFRESKGDVGCSFDHVNPLLPRVWLAEARRANGEFVVDAISTDGGCIPRNVICENAMALVRLGGLSMLDFVKKTSLNPARMLNLTTKGSFAAGMDADITVIDPEKGLASDSFVAGQPVLKNFEVIGTGGTVFCQEEGLDTITSCGLKAQVVKPDACAMIAEHQKKLRTRLTSGAN